MNHWRVDELNPILKKDEEAVTSSELCRENDLSMCSLSIVCGKERVAWKPGMPFARGHLRTKAPD